MTELLDDADFVSGEFTMVHPNLVRKMGGDLDGVYVLARVRFRCSAQNVGDDGRRWWRTTIEDLADELGLSTPQVKRTVKRLIESERLLWKIDNEHNYDRTRSYSVNALSRQGTKSSLGRDGIVPSSVRNRPVVGTESSLLLSPLEGLEELQETNPSPPPAAPDLFDAFWKVYPAKKGKIAAKKAWARAIKVATPDEIIAGAMVYRTDARVLAGYVKDPATWLNGGHWSDEPDAPRREQVGAGARGKHTPFQNYADPDAYGDSLI